MILAACLPLLLASAPIRVAAAAAFFRKSVGLDDPGLELVQCIT